MAKISLVVLRERGGRLDFYKVLSDIIDGDV